MSTAVQSYDLRTVVGSDSTLRRTVRSELHGACPICGEGEDRFWINIDTNRWFCRHCNMQGGSAADYLMRRHGIGFPEAMQRLEGITIMAPVARPTLPQDAPTEEFQIRAFRYIEQWCAALWSNEGTKARAWLAARGFTEDTIRAAGLGYCPRDEAPLGWHRGITIPLLGVDGDLYGVKVRRPVRPGETPKYISLRGGHHCLFGRTHTKQSLLIVEGEFDALLGLQELGDLVDVATIGLGTPQGRWLRHLSCIRQIFLCLDNDEAGRKGMAKWSWMANTNVVQLPTGKDLTEAHTQHGVNLREWLRDLITPPVVAADAPVEEVPAPEDDWQPIDPMDYAEGDF